MTQGLVSPRERELIAEIERLRLRLEEPESTLAAIREGEVDAFVVSGREGEKVFTFHPADPPYRRIVEEMKEGAATLSTDGTILYANRRLGELLRVEAERLRSASIRDFVAEEHGAAFDELLRAPEGGRTEITMRAADGSRFPSSIAANAFRDEDLTAFSLVVTDLTDQKINAELAAADQVWREADRRKDEFLATLGHELRTPLAAINRAAEVIEHLCPAEERLRWACEVVRRQIRSMARMVDDLLDVSRIATGKMAIRKETVDWSALAGAIGSSLAPVFEEKGRSLTVSLPDRPVLVEADSMRLAQVISNLLQNALKFTREGGRVVLSLTERDGRAVLRVKDDGVGILPEMLDRVFDIFAQGDRLGSRSESGLGIGLALVRRLMELQDGTVSAASEGRDRGAEFTVTLPLSSAPGARFEDEAPPADASAGAPRRVLIVEDDMDLARGLAILLQLRGHAVATANDGASARVRAAELRPEIVFLDLGLPGMDGFEIARLLRADLGTSLVLVALTGYSQDEDRMRTAQAGFDHHLVKPVDVDRILRLLAAMDEKGSGRDR